MNQLLEGPYLHAKKSRYLWLLDAGHGGLDDQLRYATKPIGVPKDKLRAMGITGYDLLYETKSFIDQAGGAIFEGAINRSVAKQVYLQLEKQQIDFQLLYHDVEDSPLSERVRKADNAYAKDKRAVLVSLHSDKLALSFTQSPKVHTDMYMRSPASGCSVWTSKGQTRSDKVANIFVQVGEKEMPNMKFRKDQADGDADMEADFYLLRKTDCPAILCETGFYDHPQDGAWLTSAEGMAQYAGYIIKAIQTCEQLKPI